MKDFDEKMYNHTFEFALRHQVDVDSLRLKESIRRHLCSARQVVTDATLERLGYQHVAVMINTAAQYNLSLGQVLMEAVATGAMPVSNLCSTLRKRKTPNLRVVK